MLLRAKCGKLVKQRVQAGTDTQRDKQLTAALGDAYAQKKHEKTANHKRKA